MQALGGMAGGRHFRKPATGWDLREAQPHEIAQKRACPIILIIVSKFYLEFHH